MPSWCARLRDREDGFGIVEVMVSAMVLLVGLLGTVSLIDGAQKSSGRQKAKSVAAALAEQDQERMRATPIEILKNYSERRVETVGGVEYTIESSTRWLRDASGDVVTCIDAGQSDYMRISSTVTNSARGTLPLTIASLLAPPVGSMTGDGSLAVVVKNRSGGPQPNIGVAASNGAGNWTGSTNEAGCAIFEFLPVGNYSVNFNSPGLVNPLGASAFTISGVVSPGQLNKTTPQLYDAPASIDVSFQTKLLSGAIVASNAPYASAGNSGIGNATGARWFGTGAAAVAIRQDQLFPFADGYTVYSGQCAANDPTDYIADYYASNPGLVAVDPGSLKTVRVFHPAINVRARVGSTATANLNVVLRSRDSGCKTVMVVKTDAAGALVDPGVPWGRWELCADNGTRKSSTRNVTNTAVNGTARQDLDIATSGNSGPCPRTPL
jgi:Tfp pilus assembly protein PilV